MAEVPASDRFTAFMARLTEDAEFTSAVAADPQAVAAAAGLSDAEQARVVWAVQRVDRATQNHALAERARAESDKAAPFAAWPVDDLVALGTAAAAMTKMIRPRSDDELLLWGDVGEWRDRMAWLRQINAEWPRHARRELGSRATNSPHLAEAIGSFDVLVATIESA